MKREINKMLQGFESGTKGKFLKSLISIEIKSYFLSKSEHIINDKIFTVKEDQNYLYIECK